MSEAIPVSEILGAWPESPDNLIPALQKIQSEQRYLSEDALRAAARYFHTPLPHVYHVATFYKCFSLEPRGRHHVKVCLGTACHVRGATLVLDRLLRELKLGTPGTTKDLEFTLETVRCVGCCGLAPVVVVDSKTHPHLSQARVPVLVKKYKPPERAKATP